MKLLVVGKDIMLLLRVSMAAISAEPLDVVNVE